jgi:hypothetical protein
MITRGDNAARDLLARLADETELETVPIEDVRADLALLGVNPTRSIKFSRKLSEQAASPAGAVLAKSLAAEDSDRETAALETADLRTVQAELAAVNPLAAAHAQRLANATMQSARRRSSRRLWYGIGGAVTALAASVVIVIGLSNQDVGTRQFAAAPDGEQIERLRSQEEQTIALKREAARAPAAPTAALQAPEVETSKSVSSVNSDSGSLDRVARGSGADAENSSIATNFNHDFNGGTLNLGGGATWSFDRDASALQGGIGDLTVTEALILQPQLAPDPLRQANIGAGNLAARLPETAQIPVRSAVVALVTLQRADGTTVEAALLRFRVQHLQESEDAAPSETAASSTLSEPAGAQQTLRALLGVDIREFLVVEIKPPGDAKQN